MKSVLILLAACLVAAISGCAVADGSADNVGRQFEQGLKGEGRIVPDNPTSDRFGPDYR